MADTSLIVRPPSALIRQRALLQQRLSESRHRLHDAIARARRSARALTPAARIGESPCAWVVGALIVGLALGRLSRSL